MLEEVGIAQAVTQARKMGMGNVPSVPSLALGSGEVTLMAMTSAYAAFADQGQLRPAMFIRRVEDADGKVLFEAKPAAEAGAVAADRVPHDEHAVRRRELRNRVQGATGRLHAAGGRQDRNDQRLRRRVVRRVHAESRHRRLDRVRQAAHDHLERVRRRARGADVGALHEAGDRKGQARDIQVAAGLDGGQRVPSVGPVAWRVLRSGYHGVFCAGQRTTELCQRAQLLSPHPGSLPRRFLPPPCTSRSPPAAQRSPVATDSGAPRDLVIADQADDAPKKKRGFWGRLFGRGDGDKKDDKKKAND